MNKELATNLLTKENDMIQFTNKKEIIETYLTETTRLITNPKGYVNEFINKGINLNATHYSVSPVLYYVLEYKADTEVITKLIKAGANPTVYKAGHENPVYITIKRNYEPEVLELLLKHGCSPNRIGNNRPLNLAASQNNTADITKVLLEHGADATLTDNIGETPLHNVCHLGKCVEIIPLLINAGCPINAQDSKGETALYKACWRIDDKGYSMQEQLLQLGADMHIPTLTIKDNLSAWDKVVSLYKLYSNTVDKELLKETPTSEWDMYGTPMREALLVKRMLILFIKYNTDANTLEPVRNQL